MAYTKIFAIRARLDDRVKYAVNAEKTELNEKIGYAADLVKTSSVRFVTALNCKSAETAFDVMRKTKEKFGKTGGVLGYHFIQSFAPGEVTPEQAHEIGCEFVRRLFGEDFEAVIGTHLDKAHPHNHIVVNSVSRTDGHKYHSSPESYYNDVRGTSDALCRENDLSVIAPQGKGKHYAEWKAEQGGKPTVRGIIRADIDTIIGQAYTYGQAPRRKAGDPPGQLGRGLHRSGYSAAALPPAARRHGPADRHPCRQALPNKGQAGHRPKKENHRLSRTLSPLSLPAAWGQAEKATAQAALLRQAGGHSFGTV